MAEDYKIWIDHEYQEWIKALQESTVFDFKENPVVQRMIGNFDPVLYADLVQASPLIEQIDNIGKRKSGPVSGAGLRMLYYARKVMERDFSSIVEIGGGVGQFYATLRAIGYRGDYMIMDLPEVFDFQIKYLDEVTRQTGLRLPLFPRMNYEACVSFFALGEFDDDLKEKYIGNVVNKCPSGFIIWNPHSGASREITFPCRISDQYPQEHPDCRQLEW